MKRDDVVVAACCEAGACIHVISCEQCPLDSNISMLARRERLAALVIRWESESGAEKYRCTLELICKLTRLVLA